MEEEVSDEEFDKLLEEYGTVEEVGSGEIVMATVVSVMTDSVLVDLGAKSEGIVPIEEFKDANGNLTVKEGDRVDVVAGSKDPETGQVKASRRKARMQAALAQLEAALAGDDPLTGQVVRAVKNGVIVDLGLECFMPASHIDLRRVGNLDEWVGKDIEVMVLELNRGRKRAVVSRRSWLERHQRAQREKFFAQHGEGSTVTGTVKNLTDFGVFVDLGGFDGLVPRDELSWERGLQPSDVVNPEQELTCQVVKVNLETGKITLSRKRLTPDPWETITERYKRGDIVDAVVVNTTEYGAFARLEEGLTGLIHASDLSWSTRRKKASDFVGEGDHVKAQVLEVDTQKRRLSLGLKQIQPDPWAQLEREMPPGSKVKGKVTSVTNFGIFVLIRPEVEGLIHQSDLSWETKGLDPRETAKEGEEIEAVVLRVDRVNRKISLGSKQLTDSPYVKWCKEHPVRSHVTGKVTRVVSFGAFVELTPGVEGLVHISHLSNDRVERVEDVVKPGDEVTVKVIKAEPRREKINLSIRDLLRDQERREIEQYTKGGKTTHGGSNLGELLRQAGLKAGGEEES